MNVLVIGSNGQIGRQIVKMLALDKGFFVRAMIRDPHQAEALEKLGAKPIIADLEQDFSYAYDAVDAVIFTAGSGGNTGPEKTIAVDQDAAIKATNIAEQRGIKRFIMISSIHAGEPDKGPESLATYLIAKGKADDHLMASKLPYTIIRPVSLTNEAATGRVDLVSDTSLTTIPRSDVAAFTVEALTHQEAQNKIYEIASGSRDVDTFDFN
ncbi:SDR family oxidoreductase [Listeria sp. PSOL-1]|uniref:SDR family oxidoreductase n=1 Tax=Listeria sp. PSOL-1 TaxID=1844999 RepID=UPI0013D69453|nr:SDR family oxidoreductase [Listeria sp. PSOL-1]